MYDLKKNGKVFTSKFVGTGPSSYEKGISGPRSHKGSEKLLYLYAYVAVDSAVICRNQHATVVLLDGRCRRGQHKASGQLNWTAINCEAVLLGWHSHTISRLGMQCLKLGYWHDFHNLVLSSVIPCFPLGGKHALSIWCVLDRASSW